MNEGYCKGDVCNRDDCKGIIEAGEKDGCCSCHINPPCGYCTTPTEYCPECGWDAWEEERIGDMAMVEYYKNNPPKQFVYKTDKERFDELPNGEFGYVHINSGAHTVTRLKGKHKGMSREDIFKRLGILSRPCMPMMKMYNNREFELTYFND